MLRYVTSAIDGAKAVAANSSSDRRPSSGCAAIASRSAFPYLRPELPNSTKSSASSAAIFSGERRTSGRKSSSSNLCSSTPGSRAGLLPLSPLRTARESFPSSSSSLSNAPCGTRWCHLQRLAMDLPVAVGVQEDTVLCCIPAAMGPPDSMMVVPSCKSGDLLAAHGTEAVLVFPQGQQLPSAFEGLC